MHPDDPYICYDCGIDFQRQNDYARHMIRCRKRYENWPAPPQPLVEVISEAQIEEARDDLVDLLRELS